MKGEISTHQLDLYKSFFTGRLDVYGTYDLAARRARVVKQPVTDRVILDHLAGKQPYGVFLLDGEWTRAAAVDFDSGDAHPPLAWARRAREWNIACVIERSKSKGYHAWVFFEQPCRAANARRLLRSLLRDIGQPNPEVFPKQDRLTPTCPIGNFINAPLFGALVPQGRTVFLDPEAQLKPYPDQWEFLRSIQRVPEALVRRFLAAYPVESLAREEVFSSSERPSQNRDLLPCARRILSEGVQEFQRVITFRLAIHLKNRGDSLQTAIRCLMQWRNKNRPRKGRGIIRPEEIVQQVQFAYAKNYRRLGCEDPEIRPFCDPHCPIFRNQRK
ncbi:MAG: hypothetical protein AB1656_24605 [Candidatus Omnitrophota bacterium]